MTGDEIRVPEGETDSEVIADAQPLTCGRCNSEDVQVWDGADDRDPAIIECRECGHREYV